MKPDQAILMLLLTAGLLASCNAPRNIHGSDPEASKDAQVPNILFLNYQLTRDSAENAIYAELLSMIVREGKFKPSVNQAFQPEIDDLELQVLDLNQQILSTRHIPNPLDKSVEYVNENGRLEKQMIHLDSVQFSVRLQIEPRASSILLKRISASTDEGNLLLLTPIL